MRIDSGGFELRAWREGDQTSLVQHANDYQIWRNLRDRFPHPYTQLDAESWIQIAVAQDPTTSLAIAVGDEAVGGVSMILQHDVERCSAEIGYWLGRSYWGRGIMSRAVRVATQDAFDRFELTRVLAMPFAYNAASFRVLEKAGYRKEGVMRRSAVKEGLVVDQVLYATTDQDFPSQSRA